jgi:hypothetical protein
MTPKEKAKELFYKMFKVKSTSGYPMYFDTAKQCALIAVDEILNYLKTDGFSIQINYYQEVKQEIEKL